MAQQFIAQLDRSNILRHKQSNHANFAAEKTQKRQMQEIETEKDNAAKQFPTKACEKFLKSNYIQTHK